MGLPRMAGRTTMSGKPDENEIPPEVADEAVKAAETSSPSERARRLARYEELCKRSSVKIKPEDLAVLSEYSKVIGAVSTAELRLRQLVETYPDRLPEHLKKTCANNLKETVMVMLNEFHQLRNGASQKKYDKRQVCRKCHNVFLVALPKDGICDECRAEGERRAKNRYDQT